jgi:hypothetical protein
LAMKNGMKKLKNMGIKILSEMSAPIEKNG